MDIDENDVDGPDHHQQQQQHVTAGNQQPKDDIEQGLIRADFTDHEVRILKTGSFLVPKKTHICSEDAGCKIEMCRMIRHRSPTLHTVVSTD
ncbi:unnamed protein product, partial [Gongylonema pulchrum]|uniref:Protein kinase domain-containing protein n=1 Tax=Gongylonema pulchrum TaxID=637853 RepID=A0A183D8K3_9BILA